MGQEFQFVAGHLALDFVNTLDYRYDAARIVELLPTFGDFLAFAEQARIISKPEADKLVACTGPREANRTHEQIIELREALYFLFQSVAAATRPSAAHLEALNRFLGESRPSGHIVWRKGDFVYNGPDLTGTPRGPLWPVMDAAAELLVSPDRHLIHECSDNSCRWLFLDRSKNHSRRWCDMRICGNRAKVQRFHARQCSGNRSTKAETTKSTTEL